MSSRYDSIFNEVAELEPEVIVEIGTWNGKHAAQMMQRVPDSKYYGFDLFDEATDETDAIEFNVKPHCTKQAASESLKDYDHELIQGNTNQTLPDFVDRNSKLLVDLAFIDGGHSVATIASDFEHIKKLMRPGGTILFDDYYLPPRKGLGCNDVIADLEYELLPYGDGVAGGGLVFVAKVIV